jgi:hypothetical protein
MSTSFIGLLAEGKEKGKILYEEGGYYEGEIKQNTIDGFGKLFYPSNNLAYAGYWK